MNLIGHSYDFSKGKSISVIFGAISTSSRPGKPRNVVGTPGNGKITVAFDPPLDLGTPPGTTYTATATPHAGGSGITNTGSSSPIVVSTLSNGTGYDVTVHLTNTVGDGPESDLDVTSTNITPTASVPDAPTSLISGGTNYATIVPLSWTAPASDGGSAITGYKVRYRIGVGSWTTVSTGNTSTSYTVNSLTESTTYEFQVAATNAVGDSSWSSSHNETTEATWAPSSVSGYYAEYSADNLSLTGSTIDRIDDISGNSRHLTYRSGTKFTRSTTAIQASQSGIVIPDLVDGFYKLDADITFTDAFIICTHVSPWSLTHGGHIALWNNHLTIDDYSATNTDRTANAVVKTGCSPRNTAEMIEGWCKSTGGNQTGVARNGDFSGASTSSTGASSGTGTLAWGSSGGDFVAYTLTPRRMIAIAAMPGTSDRQKLEGYMAWDLYGLHNSLPVGHPYKDVTPTGTITVPSTPTILRAYPSASGQITIIVKPQDEGGSTCTFAATGSPGGSGSAQSFTVPVSSLSNGTTYSFTVTAANLAGTTSASSSASVTPTASSLVPLTGGWNLAEASGATALDMFGGYDLTNHGTVGTNASGVNGGLCRTFGGSDWLETTADDTLAMVNTDFSFKVSGYPTSLSGNHQWITVRNSGAGGNICYMIRTEGTSLVLYIGDGSGAYSNWTLATGLSTNTWKTVAVCFDKTTKAARYSIDGGAAASAGSAGGSKPTNSSGLKFGIGGMDSSETMTGRLDAVGIVNRKWSDAELQAASAGVEF